MWVYGLNKTLITKKKLYIFYFCVFGCKCFVHNNEKANLGNFDARSYEAIFLGYASNSKKYRVYNNRTMCIVKSVRIIFDETNSL